MLPWRGNRGSWEGFVAKLPVQARCRTRRGERQLQNSAHMAIADEGQSTPTSVSFVVTGTSVTDSARKPFQGRHMPDGKPFEWSWWQRIWLALDALVFRVRYRKQLRQYELGWQDHPVKLATSRAKRARMLLAHYQDIGSPDVIIRNQAKLVENWERLVKERKVMVKCKSCGADVFWKKHVTTGKSAPLNAGPDPTGNLRLVSIDNYEVVPEAERESFLASGGELFRPHYSTCPQAKTWRTGRKA